jgi:CrcB protein
VSGSFLIGLFMTLMAERLTENPVWRLFLVIGILGGYTTFSSFEYESGKLITDGEYLYATLNVVLSVVVGFAELKAGEILAKVL